jgi:hypothetical protein
VPPYNSFWERDCIPDNIKLTLYFRRIPLGVLEKIENEYIYTSYIENEQQTQLMQLLTTYEYSLWGSSKRKTRKLFSEFEEIIIRCSRADILEYASINPQDSAWDKLIKLSRLQWFTPNFYVQQTKDIEAERNYYLKPSKAAIEFSPQNDGG